MYDGGCLEYAGFVICSCGLLDCVRSLKYGNAIRQPRGPTEMLKISHHQKPKFSERFREDVPVETAKPLTRSSDRMHSYVKYLPDVLGGMHTGIRLGSEQV